LIPEAEGDCLSHSRRPDKGINRQIVLARRPVGMVDASCFARREGIIPEPGPEQALLRVLCVAIDPAIRGWLNERGSGYLPALALGEPVRSNGVGVVVRTTTEALPVGALVTTLTGWQEWAVACSDFSDIAKLGSVIPEGVQPVEALTVHGQIATTSYVGVEVVAKPDAGQTMLVSAAASAVGSLVGQMARRRGALVIGIVGTEEKRRWVTDELGFEACINYRTDDIAASLLQLAPQGVDVFFDNVGGPILDTVLRRMALHGRVILCGTLSTSNLLEPYRLQHWERILSRRISVVGFNAMDHWDRFPQATKAVSEWIADGSIKYRAHVLDGLERAPEALVRLFKGDHLGKLVIKVADP
jgi:NADPH-dependent curcumin reductase CurA